MSARANRNFFRTYYDRIALAIGALALVGAAAFLVMVYQEPDAEEASVDAAVAVSRMRPSENGVSAVDMLPYDRAVKLMETPPTVKELTGAGSNFLASEGRVFCKNAKCHKAIPSDVKAFPECPFCKEKREVAAPVVLDADGDGLPDEWEKKYGLNPNDANDADLDKDGDGFTNREEFEAKTDPTDPKDHPDYLDSLKVTLPLKETYMSFVFTKATKIPSGWRCEFFFPGLKDDYGRMGRTVTAVLGEEIGKGTKNPSGYVLKSYEKKEEKQARKGMQGMTVAVDVSEVTVERKADKKVVRLVVVANKKAKPQAVDVQASLVYERGGLKTFDVVQGAEIDLNGEKYRVSAIRAVGKGARVTLKNVLTGKERTLSALEPVASSPEE